MPACVIRVRDLFEALDVAVDGRGEMALMRDDGACFICEHEGPVVSGRGKLISCPRCLLYAHYECMKILAPCSADGTIQATGLLEELRHTGIPFGPELASALNENSAFTDTVVKDNGIEHFCAAFKWVTQYMMEFDPFMRSGELPAPDKVDGDWLQLVGPMTEKTRCALRTVMNFIPVSSKHGLSTRVPQQTVMTKNRHHCNLVEVLASGHLVL